MYAVFRELERELGDEIPAMLEGLEREYVRQKSSERGMTPEISAPIDLFSDFAWRGIGNPSKVEQTPSGIDVVVENPFHPGLVAGRVAGLYEAWTEKSVLSAWNKESPGRIRVTLK
jgi:hypothetical protein